MFKRIIEMEVYGKLFGKTFILDSFILNFMIYIILIFLMWNFFSYNGYVVKIKFIVIMWQLLSRVNIKQLANYHSIYGISVVCLGFIGLKVWEKCFFWGFLVLSIIYWYGYLTWFCWNSVLLLFALCEVL